MDQTTMKVHQAIIDVMGDLAEVGIAKEKRNTEQGFNYRGIDDLYNTLAKILASRKLCILPTILEREVIQRTTKSNSIMYNIVLKMLYRIVSAEDGSTVECTTYGEASDMTDKGTNKAMSAAYKYLCFQLFCIPIDVQDPDATTPPETAAPKAQGKATGKQTPEGGYSVPPKAQGAKSQGTKPAASTKQAAATKTAQQLSDQLEACADDPGFLQLAADVYRAVKGNAVTVETGRPIALAVLSNRADLVDEATIESLRKMCNSFMELGLVTADEAAVAISNTEARLNIGAE